MYTFKGCADLDLNLLIYDFLNLLMRLRFPICLAHSVGFKPAYAYGICPVNNEMIASRRLIVSQDEYIVQWENWHLEVLMCRYTTTVMA